MSLKVTPLSVESCHCTVGAGWPLAAAVKVTFEPAQMVWVSGLVVTTGGVFTVRVAALLLVGPQASVKTARNLWLLSAAVGGEGQGGEGKGATFKVQLPVAARGSSTQS